MMHQIRKIADSELITNDDGSIFHLHMLPEQLADTIILVGDPARSNTVASFFDSITSHTENREFVSNTGTYNGKRISVISTGIGTDNIDIVLNEIDALANIDLITKEVKSDFKKLTIVRLGTCGGVQEDIKIGDYIVSRSSVSTDAIGSYYKNHEKIYNYPISEAFNRHMGVSDFRAKSYIIDNDKFLVNEFERFAKPGITLSATGFYAPQGRSLRLEALDHCFVEKLSSFEFEGEKVMNIEMEGSAIAALSALMGHRAVTVCTIVAQRKSGRSKPSYQNAIEKMIVETLKILANIK